MKYRIIISIGLLIVVAAALAQPQATKTLRVTITNAGDQQITLQGAEINNGCSGFNISQPANPILKPGESGMAMVSGQGTCNPQIVFSFQSANGTNGKVSILPNLANQCFGTTGHATPGFSASVVPTGSSPTGCDFTVMVR